MLQNAKEYDIMTLTPILLGGRLHMGSKLRQDEILKILEDKGYVTVKYLSDLLHYSTATINRDLNDLQKRGLISRSYGGAELIHSPYVPIMFRAQKMRSEKMHIGKAAAGFVSDGDVIFIDGSTTAQYMEQYLIERKGLTVITNNMMLAINLSKYDVKVICLGGPVAEAPCMLYGSETVENAKKYRVNKMFFSSSAISHDGVIASGVFDLMLKEVAKNSKEIYYLFDHKKIDRDFCEVYGTLDDVDCVISDYTFSPQTVDKFKNTKFVRAEG